MKWLATAAFVVWMLYINRDLFKETWKRRGDDDA